jgi:hypothetical protein
MLVGPCASGAAQEHRETDAGKRARQLVTRFELPEQARAAVRELVELGPAALPALHVALRDPRPEVVQWALFASSGLADVESLREPIRLLMASKDLGVAIAAARACAALDGRGSTLITDYRRNHVLQIDRDEQETVIASQPMVMSAARLPDGHLLVAAYRDNRVLELDAKGEEVWSYRELRQPSDAQRLPGGNTLIADSSGGRAVEVDRDGKVVWQYAESVRPIHAARLGNGNTLICSYQTRGVVEVDPAGKIVWQMPGKNVRDADRLPDGTTLVTITDERRVVLVDAGLKVLQEWQLGFAGNDSELLPDGHLLVGGEGCVVELDNAGTEVWRRDVPCAGRVARYGRRVPTPGAKAEAGK